MMALANRLPYAGGVLQSDCLTAEPSPERDYAPAGKLDLASFVEAAPFGLTIADAGGRVLCSNSFADDADDGRSLRTRPFRLKAGGEIYMVNLTLDETEELEREKRLFNMAYFDELTGLPNRAVFEQSVAGLIKDGNSRFAIAFVDLDRFRNVNDFFGRPAGDALLIKVAGRIASHLEETDLLARMSGNAFVILLALNDSRRDAMQLLTEIAERIKEPFVIEGQEVLTSASVGASIFPSDGHTFGTLTWNAERAMRGSRLETLGAVRFYDRSMERAVADKNRAEQRLRLAIRDRRLICAYQPKFDLRTNRVDGVEVLMRWH